MEIKQKDMDSTTTLNRSLRDMVHADDRHGIIAYFTEDVKNLAEKYTQDTPLDYLDLVEEGNLALVDYVMNQKHLRQTTIIPSARDAIKMGIRRAVLAENLEKKNIEYNNEALMGIEVDPIGDLMNKEEMEAIKRDVNLLLNTFPYQQREVVKIRHGLDEYHGRQSTFKEIGKKIKTTGSNANGLYLRAIKKLRRMAERLPSKYLEVIVPPAEAIKKRASGEELENIEKLIYKAKEDIEAMFGGTVQEFMHRYDLSRMDFIDYVSNLYPELQRKYALRIVTLSEEEKKNLIKKHLSDSKRFGNLESMRRTLKHLESKKKKLEEEGTTFDEQKLLERLRELYMPMFSLDKERCLDTVKKEAGSEYNPAVLKKLFRRLYRYFDSVKNLKVDGISTELDDFQKVDVEILSKHNNFIIASEMGTGKSLEVIAYAMNKGIDRVLIVSTKSGAYLTWPSEIRKHLKNTPSVAILDGQKFRHNELMEEASNARWFITTYATATRYIDQLRTMGFDLVVLDESHKINNKNTNQSVALSSLESPNKLAVSGFIFKNYRKELFPVLNWLFPEDFLSEWEFERLYCMDDQGLYRLQYELRRKMILRLKEEVLKLPKVDHSRETITLGKYAKTYKKMEDDFMGWYKKNVGEIPDKLSGVAVLMKMHGIRKKAIEPKIPLINEIVRSNIGDGRKTVLYTTYIPFAEKFKRMYKGLGVCYLDGSTRRKERVSAIQEFGTNPKKKLFIVTAAGGESIDITPASDIIFANKPFTYADEKQMLDRLHRRGQGKTVRAFHITTLDTIDERIERLIERKREEYQRVISDTSKFACWFEDIESQNIRELMSDMIKDKKMAKAGGA